MGNGAEHTVIGRVIAQELRRRARSVGWYVLVIGYAVMLVGATLLALWVSDAAAALSHSPAGAATYGVVLLCVVLFVIVAVPPISGTTLQRIGGVGAPGRILAALAVEAITGALFVVIALPFLAVAATSGGVSPGAVLLSVLVLLVECWLLAAIGVGFGGIFRRPAGAVWMTYLITAVLAVGSVVLVAVVGGAVQHDVVTVSRSESWTSSELLADCDAAYEDGATDCREDGDGVLSCSEWSRVPDTRGRFDLVWWALVPNPFVVVADAASAADSTAGGPLQTITLLVRQARDSGRAEQIVDSCTIDGQDRGSTVAGVIEDTPSTWAWGILVQALIAAALLAGARARLGGQGSGRG